jgi:hypothetical protein
MSRRKQRRAGTKYAGVNRIRLAKTNTNVPEDECYLSLHRLCEFANLFDRDRLLGSGEGVILRQKQHAVTFMTLAHWDAGAIPKGGGHFSFLIGIVATGTKGRTQIVLVLGKTFEDDGRDPQILTEVRARAARVGFGKLPHCL